MAELKTKETAASVSDFLAAIENEERREDCHTVAKMMEKATGAKAKMWGTSIVGFGTHAYSNMRGASVDWFLVGFSPRKADLTLYIMPGVERYADLLNRLGKYKTGKACLYIKRLADIDQKVLRAIIESSVEHLAPPAQ